MTARSDTFSRFPYLGCGQYVERIGVENTVFSVFIKTKNKYIVVINFSTFAQTNNILMYNIRTATGMALSSLFKIRKQTNHKIAKLIKYTVVQKKKIISFLSDIQNDLTVCFLYIIILINIQYVTILVLRLES